MSEQLTFDAAMSTTALYPAAVEWRDANPEAWALIVAWAIEDAELRGYCSMQAYMEALRSPAIARRVGLTATTTSYKVDHRIRTELTRLIMAEHPELPFHPRKAEVDQQGTHATPSVGRRI